MDKSNSKTYKGTHFTALDSSLPTFFYSKKDAEATIKNTVKAFEYFRKHIEIKFPNLGVDTIFDMDDPRVVPIERPTIPLKEIIIRKKSMRLKTSL